jgi:hypothetical protein
VKIPRLLGALAAVTMVVLPAAAVHATTNPTIVSIATQGCADDKVCVTLTVDNPTAGTIALELTGHTPGSSVFVDTGARLSFTIVPGTTTYTGCFDNVSSFTAGHDFNTLRVEFFSSDIANLDGTTTKSVSFAPCTSASPTPTPTPTPSGTPTPSPSGSPTPTPSGSPTPTPSGRPTPTPSGSATPTPTASQPPGSTPTPSGGQGGGSGLAQTGGFDFRFLLAGLAILVIGLSVLGVSAARSRSAQP